jgi:hypothetical protein
MSVATVMGVKQAAQRATNRKGGIGVSPQYIKQEIKSGNLKADLVPAVVGKPYYIIQEQDFLDWEAKRGRPPQENEP